MILISCPVASGQNRQSDTKFPNEIILGVHTFIDVGPPNDFYEVYVLRSSGQGTSIERLTVTPAGQACIQPPTVERATAKLDQSIPELLHGKNPCLIPEKELEQERTRCKNCLVFSGADVNMQVQCGPTMRTLRIDVLDKDMFDPSPHTPENTSQTMELLNKLDSTLGGGVMQRPMFSLSTMPSTEAHSEAIEQLRDGKFDSLFRDAPDKPSTLFTEAQIAPPVPSILLLSISPIPPITPNLPLYPPIARLARVEGKLVFKLVVTNSGTASDVTVLNGPKMLAASVVSAVSKWTFPQTAAGKVIEGTIDFELNCPSVHP
jgi:Gram-negative bacterial TonB protein C-terminal